MSTTYRLTAIGDDGLEKDVGVLGTLKVPPHSILVLMVDPATREEDLQHLRKEWAWKMADYPGWKDTPTIIIRAGDLRFACLTRVEG